MDLILESRLNLDGPEQSKRHLIDADASRKRRAEVIDRMAAAYILQGALDRLKRLSEVG